MGEGSKVALSKGFFIFKKGEVEMAKCKYILSNLPEYALGVIAILLISLVFLEVILRYFLQLPVGWSEEGAMVLFFWLSYLGAAVCTKRKGHFSFLMIKDRLSAKNQHYLSFMMQMIIIGASIILIIQGVRMLQMASYERYVMLGISKVWSYISIPICAGLILIYASKQLFDEIKDFIFKSRNHNEMDFSIHEEG